MAAIVQTSLFVTLLGGAPTHFSHVIQSLKQAPILVCADGGANAAVEAGLTPEAVIGDLDSISPGTRAALDVQTVHHVAEQDSTDFEKCLAQIDAPAILAHGFMGGRVDHQLAAFNALARVRHQRCILVGEEDLCFLAPASLTLDVPQGTRLSLFPLGPAEGWSQGLKYPIEGLRFAPAGQIGTSNEVTGPVTLKMSGPMLIILPVAHLSQVLEQLSAAAPA